MSIDLIISPPSSGKTETCIQKIKAFKSTQPLAKAWVLVPDSQKAAYFRRRLAEAGGGVGVHVGTFRSIYIEILETAGKFVPVIAPALEHRLVQQTIDEAFKAGELEHYGPIRQKPGFILALQDAFAELRSALVYPDQFLEYTRGSTPAAYELALIYCRFLTRIHELNWIDQEGQSWLAISALEKNPQVAANISLVVVDGFTSFTGARQKFMQLLSDQVGEMLITLPGKPGSTRQVHRRSQSVIETLQNELNPQLVELAASPHLPEEICHLEKHILDPGEYPQSDLDNPLFIEVRSQAEEAREALRWIKELNQRKYVDLSTCAIFAPNLETYQPLLRSAANEFGLQVYFSHADPLSDSPAVIGLLSVLSLPVQNFKVHGIFAALHSPYFDFGLSPKEIEDLEKVSRQASVVMGRDQWESAWSMLEKSRTVLANEPDDERQRDDITAGIDLNFLRNTFAAFWQIFDSIPEAQSLQEWVTWLESLLEKLHFYEKISGERDREACASLGDTLKAMLLSESVLGIHKENYPQFLSDLQGAIGGSRVDEPRESRNNSVFIGRMVEARGSRFSAVALLGFSEGLFPAVENPDPFLGEGLRLDLGMESRLQREQASIFYQAFTRADSYLLFTRPYLSEDGEAWEPSPYWLSATKLFTKNAVIRVHPGTSRPQSEAASPQELLFWGIQQNHLAYPEDEDLYSRWQFLDQAGNILNIRRSKSARSEYDGAVDEIAAILASQYSVEHPWSASRLEGYGTCPFEFYAGNVLKLSSKELPELGLDAAQLGSIFHRILEMVYKNASDPCNVTSVLAALEDIAASIFLKAPEVYGFRPSPLWRVEKVQFVEKLRQTIEALNEISSGWTPLRFEEKFGIKRTPPLVLDIGGEMIRVHGVIDRVDKNSDSQIRIIDYKTGGSNLEKTDLKTGRRLQLPIYALAAQEALGLGEVEEGFYWKINEARASSFKLSNFETEKEAGPEAAYDLAISHIKRFLAGIRSGEFSPKPPRGGCPSYCPAAQWCWHYQGGY